MSCSAVNAGAGTPTPAECPRRPSLDVIRVVAICAVVLIHAFQSTYANTPAAELGGSLPLAMATYVGRLGVPLFLFLSGTLLLNKRFESDADVLRFYKRNFLPLLLTVEVWCTLYTFWLWGTGTEDANLCLLLARLLFFEQLPVFHWWYMPMILGVYLAVPLVAMAVQRVSFKIAAVPLAIVLIDCILVPTANDVLGYMGYEPLGGVILDSAFYGGNYGLYLLLGYYLDRRGLFQRVPKKALVAGFAVSLCLGIYEVFIGIPLWYNNLWVLLGALFLFEFLRRLDASGALRPAEQAVPAPQAGPVVWISRTSFGIYLCHVMFLSPIQTLLEPIGSIALRSLACALVLFAVSIAFVSAVQLIAPLRRVLFDMK